MEVLVPRHPLRAAGRRWCGGCLIAWCALAMAAKLPAAVQEYQIKAVFLYNFVRFVDWPTRTFAAAHTPLVIGVLGADPFGGALDDAVRGESVNGHPLAVQRFRRVEDVVDCAMLFISRSEAGRLESILVALRHRSILTVSDAENFARRGGMIRFVNENNKVRLRINVGAAREAGLTISSKLLRPAEIVTGPQD